MRSSYRLITAGVCVCAGSAIGIFPNEQKQRRTLACGFPLLRTLHRNTRDESSHSRQENINVRSNKSDIPVIINSKTIPNMNHFSPVTPFPSAHNGNSPTAKFINETIQNLTLIVSGDGDADSRDNMKNDFSTLRPSESHFDFESKRGGNGKSMFSGLTFEPMQLISCLTMFSMPNISIKHQRTSTGTGRR